MLKRNSEEITIVYAEINNETAQNLEMLLKKIHKRKGWIVAEAIKAWLDGRVKI